MKSIFFLFLLVGCAAPHSRVVPPTTLQVARSIRSANEGTIKARESADKARRAVVQLEKRALPAQRPNLAIVKRSLGRANAELIAVSHSLAQADAQTGVLQQRIDGLADDLGRAQDAERRSRGASGFWRGWAFRLGLLSTALAIWTLRRPIAALFGGVL